VVVLVNNNGKNTVFALTFTKEIDKTRRTFAKITITINGRLLVFEMSIFVQLLLLLSQCFTLAVTKKKPANCRLGIKFNKRSIKQSVKTKLNAVV